MLISGNFLVLFRFFFFTVEGFILMAFRKVSFSTCCELWVTRLLVLSVKWVVFELTGIAAVITGEIRVSCHQLLETTEELRSRLYVVQPVETRQKAAPLREVNTHDFMTHGGFQHSGFYWGIFFLPLSCHSCYYHSHLTCDIMYRPVPSPRTHLLTDKTPNSIPFNQRLSLSVWHCVCYGLSSTFPELPPTPPCVLVCVM